MPTGESERVCVGSEHIDFTLAYAIATTACVGLIGVYLARVLHSHVLAAAFSGALASLYAGLYALLRAEDYSLLGGSIVLFLLLAAVMLATRRLDWAAFVWAELGCLLRALRHPGRGLVVGRLEGWARIRRHRRASGGAAMSTDLGERSAPRS